LSEGAEVSVLVVDGTRLVAEAQRRHGLAPTATAALGRTLLGALLMGAYRKEDEQVQITFRGDGPAGSILAMADTRGNVKGKVDNPAVDPPLREDGKLNVGGAVGKETMKERDGGTE
ncbi:chaperonin, partial [Tetrabaena socialis]